MSIVKSYRHGIIKATRHPKMTALLWLFNLLPAIPAYFLFRAFFGGTIGPSLAAADLLKKADMNTIFEVLTSSGVALGGLLTAVLLLVVFQALVSIFIFGGILDVVVPGKDGAAFGQSFFGGGARFYGRFFRVDAYSLVLWVPAVIFMVVLNVVLNPLSANPVREQLGFILNVFQVLVAVFLVYVIKMILDYSRILIAAGNTRQVFRSLVEAVRVVVRRPARTLGLYYLLALTGWAAFAFYLGVQAFFRRRTTGTIILGFVIAQVFIASRAWLKIAFQAGQMNLLESVAARQEPDAALSASTPSEGALSGEPPGSRS